MADAMDQAVETAEAQTDTPVSESENGSAVMPEDQKSPPKSDTTPDAAQPEAASAEEAPQSQPDTEGEAPRPEAPEAVDKEPPPEKPVEKDKPPENSVPNGVDKIGSTGIPEPERMGDLPPLDSAQFPPLLVQDRYSVFPSMALPDLNSPSALAYAAEDRRDPGRHLFALICKPGMPVRTDLMKEVKRHVVTGMMALVDFGPVLWKASDQVVMAIVLERPMGGRFLDSFGDRPPRINEYELGKLLIEPVALAVSSLAQFDFAHRAVRLDNLFFKDKERTELVLGECYSSPPGYNQPSIYEPLERAYAMPSGRGYGMSYDDMYALGIMTVFSLLGYNPIAHLNEDDMLAAKAELGSYQCMCGQERIPLPLIEPLRGLLSDDEFERWNMEALELWLNGQKKTPIQRRSAPKPKTSFKFAGKDHRTPRSIAQAFSKNVPEAARIIRSGKLEQWLNASLGANEMADSISSSISMSKVHQSTPDGTDDILVSKICMRLDPSGPIRYKGFSFMPDGFGSALAMEYLLKGSVQIPGEILARDLPSFWFAAQERPTPDMPSLEKSFQSLRTFAKTNEWGYGMERCLYELNETIPCQSGLLRTNYVENIEDILPALDDVADHTDTRSRPVDKHIAAYIATHFKFDISPHLKAITDSKEETSLIGLLSLFALMQWRMNIKSLFGLSSWMGGLLAPAIGTYHSRTTQRNIEREIPALVRKGSLPELFDLIDNAERRQKDTEDFEEAQLSFSKAEAEIDEIAGEDVDQEKQALQSGERVTAVVSAIFSSCAIMIIIFTMGL